MYVLRRTVRKNCVTKSSTFKLNRPNIMLLVLRYDEGLRIVFRHICMQLQKQSVTKTLVSSVCRKKDCIKQIRAQDRGVRYKICVTQRFIHSSRGKQSSQQAEVSSPFLIATFHMVSIYITEMCGSETINIFQQLIMLSSCLYLKYGGVRVHR